jgi:hypothetical protein
MSIPVSASSQAIADLAYLCWLPVSWLWKNETDIYSMTTVKVKQYCWPWVVMTLNRHHLNRAEVYSSINIKVKQYCWPGLCWVSASWLWNRTAWCVSKHQHRCQAILFTLRSKIELMSIPTSTSMSSSTGYLVYLEVHHHDSEIEVISTWTSNSILSVMHLHDSGIEPMSCKWQLRCFIMIVLSLGSVLWTRL